MVPLCEWDCRLGAVIPIFQERAFAISRRLNTFQDAVRWLLQRGHGFIFQICALMTCWFGMKHFQAVKRAFACSVVRRAHRLQVEREPGTHR